MKSLVVLASAVLVTATANVNPKCHRDNCLRAIIPKPESRTPECKSFLKTTVTPCKKTVYTTKTVTTMPTTVILVTATNTNLATATSVDSRVETDVMDVTATETDLATATETVIETVTGTSDFPPPPFKRVAATHNPFDSLKDSSEEEPADALEKRAAITQTPTKIPTVATACSGSVRYASACSCLGVRGTVVTAPTPTTTVTRTQTVTAVVSQTTTVATNTVTVTDATVGVTTTFSTQTVLNTVETQTLVVTDATETVVQTATVSVAPNPSQLVQLRVSSSDPNLPNGYGFAYGESFRGSTTVYYVNFAQDDSGTQRSTFSVDGGTGEVKVITGPGSSPGESVYYSTFGGAGSASYLNISPRDFAVNQGGELIVCKLVSGNPGEPRELKCKWGANQIADLWTCAGRLNFVRPGFDFSHQCRDASTSYMVSVFGIDVPAN